MSASVNLPLHNKVQKFSSGTGSSGWSRKKRSVNGCGDGARSFKECIRNLDIDGDKVLKFCTLFQAGRLT